MTNQTNKTDATHSNIQQFEDYQPKLYPSLPIYIQTCCCRLSTSFSYCSLSVFTIFIVSCVLLCCLAWLVVYLRLSEGYIFASSLTDSFVFMGYIYNRFDAKKQKHLSCSTLIQRLIYPTFHVWVIPSCTSHFGITLLKEKIWLISLSPDVITNQTFCNLKIKKSSRPMNSTTASLNLNINLLCCVNCFFLLLFFSLLYDSAIKLFNHALSQGKLPIRINLPKILKFSIQKLYFKGLQIWTLTL